MVIGELMAEMGRCDEEITKIKESLANAEKIDIRPLIQEAYQKLYTAARKCGLFAEAMQF